MRGRLLVVLGSLLIAGIPAGMVSAREAHAPPLLSPSSAQHVIAACPDAAKYADALVGGISLSDANAAVPVLTRCASIAGSADEKSIALALAAVEFSQGLLESNQVLIRRAADATASLRQDVAATDAQIHTWVLVPDVYDPRSGKAYFDDFQCIGSVDLNAAYIYVAASSAHPWIRDPRTPRAQTACAKKPTLISNQNLQFGGIGGNPFQPPAPTRPQPAPDEQLHPTIGGVTH